MASQIESLKSDAAELYRLADLTEKRRVKDILSIEAKKLETEISLLQEKEKNIPPVTAVTAAAKKAYDVKITTYAWDQTQNFVKIYVNLPKVQTLLPNNIVCNFTDSSFDLSVKELEDKNYILSLKNLYQNIIPEKSSWKIKTDTIIISLSKSGSSYEWKSLTKTNDRQFPKPPKMDNENPSTGMMNMLKQIYEEGDDEMKRAIAKAWTESHEKSSMNM